MRLSSFDDDVAIVQSFAGGPDDPRNPVVHDATPDHAKARLHAATRNAERLQTELTRLVEEVGGHGR